MSLFRRHRVSGEASTLTVVRDLVEIVAIVAAGVWAFYVFVYETRIQPSMLQPDVTFSGSMQSVGRQHGLEAIRLESTVHNVGTTAVKFLAYSVTVVGSNVVPSKQAWYQTRTSVKDVFALHYRIVEPVVVYRIAYLTHDADARSPSGLNLQPAASSRSETVFYVPAGKYDQLTAIFVGRLERQHDPSVPTTMAIGPNGIPKLGGTVPDSDAVEDDSVTIATLTLP